MTHPQLQRRVSEKFQGLAEGLAPVFAPAAQPGGPSAKSLAENYLATIEGAIVLARAHRDPERVGAAIRIFAEQVLRQVPV